MAGTTESGSRGSRDATVPDDHGRAAPAPTYDVPVLALLFAVVASPFIWIGHLALGPALAGYQCHEHTTWPVNVLTVVTALPIAVAVVVAWRIHRRARAAPASRTANAVAFIALVGFGWAVISLYVTVLEGIPNAVGVSSCPR
jgi:amino acid transporter